MSNKNEPANQVLTDPQCAEEPSTLDGAPLDTQPQRRIAYCSTCRAERASSARSANNCGTCGTFLRGHLASTKLPPDNYRRRQLTDAFFLRYQPTEEVLRSLCVQAAVTFERYEKEGDPTKRQKRLAELGSSNPGSTSRGPLRRLCRPPTSAPSAPTRSSGGRLTSFAACWSYATRRAGRSPAFRPKG
jgi:hypothetical protein